MARRGENIRKRKDGRWEGRYIKARTPEGKIQWGYVYGTAYVEVKRVLIQRKAEAGFYNLNRTDLTFEALAEVWLHSLRNSIKESTYAHYSYTLHKYLLPVLSKVPVASLEESFLEQAMQQIITPTDAAHKPLGNSSARECLSMLRRICKYAAHLRLIRPMELEVALPKAIDKISAPLSPAEQQRLHQYVQANPTPRKIGLLLGLELGLRIGEICGLQWGDFDLKLGTLNINRTVCRISCGNGHTKVVIQTPKTRTSRREIPIPKQLSLMLKKLRGSASNAAWFLSGSESKPTEPRCYRKSIKAYLKQATVRQVRPHALRIMPIDSFRDGRYAWLEGRLLASEFLGESVRYQVEVGGIQLSVNQPHFTGAPVSPYGTPVIVGFEPAQARLFADPGADLLPVEFAPVSSVTSA